MAAVLLVLLYLLAAVENRALGGELLCRNESDWKGCRRDALCALYGDCCKDAPSFVPEQQRRGSSPFICVNSSANMMSTCSAVGGDSFACDNSDVYMMSSCPAGMNHSSTRYKCEHPGVSFQDIMSDVPVTSNRTNITYRNWYCALCHRDLDAGTTDVWSVKYSCQDADLKVNSDEVERHLAYNRIKSSWVLNTTWNPETLIIDNPTPSTLVNNCTLTAHPTKLVSTVLRTCYSGSVDTCPEDWTDKDVLARCEAYTAHVCARGTVYRNQHCGMCNNNGSFDGESCCTSKTPQPPIVFNLAPDNPTMANTNETSNSSLDTCLKVRLEPHEYYIEDNDTMAVFISVYNMSLQRHEYSIDNDSRLVMCWPQFDTKPVPIYVLGIEYITVIGVSLSILFLLLHLSAFAMTPKLHNLPSMNLASLSFSLLIMYFSFVFVTYIWNSGVPCVVLAVIIHYTLLASFCWMLTIAYDINRVLRETTTKLLLTSGTHWWRFSFYSLWSWTLPAAAVGAALAVNFPTDKVPEFLRPGYRKMECYISNSEALLLFTLGPLCVITVLNAVFFIWSARLIRTTRSELCKSPTTRTNFCLYARLALIMGLTWALTWAVYYISEYVQSLVVWYVFVILNALQGFFIFLAFTCTKKVFRALREKLGLQSDKRTRGAKSPATFKLLQPGHDRW